MGTSHCKHCGTVIMIEDDDLLSEQQKIESATQLCECQEAADARRKVEEVRKAKDRIQQLFGPDCKQLNLIPISNVKIHRLLEQIVEMVSEGDLYALSFKIDVETKAKISISSKGKINIERERKIKYKLEA